MQEWENQPVDYYKILQSDPGAETDVLEGAYKKLCKYHPDKPGGNEEKFKKINKAWEILRDAGKRQAYDSWYQNHYKKGNATAPPPPPPRPPKFVVEPDVLTFENLYPGKAEIRSFVLKNEGGAFSSCTIDPADPQGHLRVLQPSSAQFPLTVGIEAIGTGWGKSFSEDVIIRFDGMKIRLRVDVRTRPLNAGAALSEAGRFIARAVRKIRSGLTRQRNIRTAPIRRAPTAFKKMIGWILVIGLLVWGGSQIVKMFGQPFVFTRDLAQGMQGNEVTELQKRLASAGVYNADLTGYFGYATEEAVKTYQGTHGIQPTGIVGPVTRARLNGNESDAAPATQGDVADADALSKEGVAPTISPVPHSPAAIVVTLVDESGKPALDTAYKSSQESSGAYMPRITVLDSASDSVVWQKECFAHSSCSFGDAKTGIFKTDPLPVGKYLLKVTIPAGTFETGTITLAKKEFEVKGNQKILSLGTVILVGIKSSP